MKALPFTHTTLMNTSPPALIFPHFLSKFLLRFRGSANFYSCSSSISIRTFCSSPLPVGVSISGDETFSGIPVVDFVEKDWSFLDNDNVNSDEELQNKIKTVLSAGEIEESCRVMVCVGTEGFVDRLMEISPCKLLVVHYSLFILAGVKEKYDHVRCWQGDIVDVPEGFAPFDAVFLPYLPALAGSLDRILRAVVQLCSPGARVVISFAQGRDTVHQHRQQYPDMVTSDLPDKITLEKVATDLSFQITEFINEPTFYLAVMKFCKAET